MFNLEESIGEWRRRLAADIKNPNVLDELEIHLREYSQAQMDAGLTAQEAFETAVERMGEVTALKDEFKKIAGMKQITERMKDSVLTLAGIPSHYLGASMNSQIET